MLICCSNRFYVLHLSCLIDFQPIRWLKLSLLALRNIFGSLTLESTLQEYIYKITQVKNTYLIGPVGDDIFYFLDGGS
jgi:hypothetical protein